ncbi:MAG: hypothetical protein WKG00_22270 [Polyangiaceae bacterium]
MNGNTKGRVARGALIVVALAAVITAGASCGDDEPTGTGGAGGAGGTSSSTGVPTASSSSGLAQSSSTGTNPDDQLGNTCISDGDCGTGLICITSDSTEFDGGGPSEGYCSKTCSTDDDCPGTGSACLDAGAESYCFRGCEYGPDDLGDFDPDKCFGRADVRCSEVSGAATVCVPNCGADVQCPGAFCDATKLPLEGSRPTGLCVAEDSVGKLPLGSACDPEAAEDTCDGFCINIVDNMNNELGSFCSQTCVLGQFLDYNCGGLQDTMPLPTAKGACYFSPSGADTSFGDLGFCAQGCSAQADCQNPLFWCFPVTDTGVGFANGFCFTTEDCTTVGADCLDAQNQPTGNVCTATEFGPKCLDPLYPVDPGTGGAGGAGGGAGGAATGGTGGTGGA